MFHAHAHTHNTQGLLPAVRLDKRRLNTTIHNKRKALPDIAHLRLQIEKGAKSKTQYVSFCDVTYMETWEEIH